MFAKVRTDIPTAISKQKATNAGPQEMGRQLR